MHKPSGRRTAGAAVTALTAGALFAVTALPASAMTVTFVRHGESEGNASGLIDTSVPGPEITELGQQQAEDVAAYLSGNGVDYDGIYASDMIRTQQTADPFADATGIPVNIQGGLREIPAGILEGQSEDEGIGRLGYAIAPLAWILGARFVQVPGSENGNEFDARVDGALKAMEEDGTENPVAFSHGGTIMFWTLMNVDNPDLTLMLEHQLDNTDVVVIEGSPEEGWTLKSWAGEEVGPATFPTKVFVNVRDLVVTPQTAGYNVEQAVKTGDISKIADAVRNGAVDVATAPIKFAKDMAEDIGDELAGMSQSANSVVSEVKSTTVAQEKAAVEPAAKPIATDKAKPRLVTKLTDGNKAEPGKALSATREKVRKAVEDAGERMSASVNKISDAAKKATEKPAKKAETKTESSEPSSDKDAA